MKMKKWFQRDNLIILILSGVLLFIIALPESDGKSSLLQNGNSSQNKASKENSEESERSADLKNSEKNDDIWEEDYAAYLEQKLKKHLEGVSGVGKVSVMITLQSSEEFIIEKDTPVSRSNTTESDSQGGSRMISQVDTQETTIYRTEGNNSEPYVVKTLLPKVEGILVVAQGAGKGNADKNITELAQALFGVEAHKVKVLPMDNAQ